MADIAEHSHRQQCRQAEPGHCALPERRHHEGCQQGAQRGAGIAADLEDRLRQTVPAAGGEAGHARTLGVEYRGAHAHQGDGQQQPTIAAGEREQQQPEQGEAHAGGEAEGDRPLVGDMADHRLKHAGGELVDEGDGTDLAEAQPEARLEDRVDRRQQRLHHVVQQMAEADGAEDERRGARHRLRRAVGLCRRGAQTALT